jgi:putative FmdB family regulatory protein
MPIYEYRCRPCGHQFEALVRSSEVRTCPSCGGSDLEQLLSLFAVSSENTRQTSLQLARKKNAKVVRDKEMSEWEDYQSHRH